MEKKAIPSIDLMRVICAIAVVITHTLPYSSFNLYVNGDLGYLCTFAVPFFFCTSAYFFTKKLESDNIFSKALSD